MSSKMLLTTRLDHRLLMNQQLKQAIALLQYSTIELKQQIKQSLDENPLVDLKEEENEEEIEYLFDKYSKNTASEYLQKNENGYENIASVKSLREYLSDQTLNEHFNKKNQEIAIAIIDCIDDDGYLTIPAIEVAKKTNNSTTEDVQYVLEIIQQFEPRGNCCS